jgi:hypothetical protein
VPHAHRVVRRELPEQGIEQFAKGDRGVSRVVGPPRLESFHRAGVCFPKPRATASVARPGRRRLRASRRRLVGHRIFERGPHASSSAVEMPNDAGSVITSAAPRAAV